MSPEEALCTTPTCRFPRVSGDEPAADVHALVQAKFSPRERG